MECCSHLRNVQELLADGKTPFERRFGEPCKRPDILSGAMLKCHPISAKDLSRLHQLGKKALPGIFLGYVLIAGGFWKGDILVADIEELGNFGRVRNSCSKAQRKRSFNSSSRRTWSSALRAERRNIPYST